MCSAKANTPTAPQASNIRRGSARGRWSASARVLAVLCTGIILAVFLRWLYFLPVDLAQEIPESALFSNSRDGVAVAAQLWTDTNKLRPDQKLSVWLSLRNTSGQPVSDIRVESHQTPGFRVIGSELQSAVPLAPFASLTARVLTLQPSTDQGRFRVTLAYVWSSGAIADRRDVLSLGPIEIGTDEQRRRSAFLRRLAGLSKDLTLPLVLAALGFWFQRRQSTRDQDLKKAEWLRDTELKKAEYDRDQRLKKDEYDRDQRLKGVAAGRDEKFKEDQEERERRHQIWASILPRLHELSERHYLPIVRSLRLVVDGWPAASVPTAEDEKTAEYLYQVLLLLRRMKYLRDDKGQIFFNSRTAERVVGLSWRIFVKRVMSEFTVVQYEAVLRVIEPGDTYLDFLDRVRRSPQSRDLVNKDLLTKFKNWTSDDFGKHVQLLRVLKESFYFEANRPFDEYWYGAKPPFGLEGKVIDELPAKADQEELAGLKVALKQYIEETKSLPDSELKNVGASHGVTPAKHFSTVQ
jgi:hypothetical protein